MACDIHIILNTSLVPRRSGGGAKDKNAWYTVCTCVYILLRNTSLMTFTKTLQIDSDVVDTREIRNSCSRARSIAIARA